MAQKILYFAVICENLSSAAPNSSLGLFPLDFNFLILISRLLAASDFLFTHPNVLWNCAVVIDILYFYVQLTLHHALTMYFQDPHPLHLPPVASILNSWLTLWYLVSIGHPVWKFPSAYAQSSEECPRRCQTNNWAHCAMSSSMTLGHIHTLINTHTHSMSSLKLHTQGLTHCHCPWTLSSSFLRYDVMLHLAAMRTWPCQWLRINIYVSTCSHRLWWTEMSEGNS